MALSFTRPDPASPASVSSAQFSSTRRGYDQAEVRDFLRAVAAEQARLQERERALERELAALQQSKAPPTAMIDEDTAVRLLGEEAARVLQTAREAAAQIKTRAEESSARLLREATDEAQRMREEAEIEAARRRQDASADSEAEIQMAKQQGRDMVNEARAYRERVLSELARRRELARQQIEQLIHGRDRLLQAFERSRIAAVEVMAELTPLGEPTEYVNLSPTTGPVPLMVAAPPLASAFAQPEPAADDEPTADIEVAVAADDAPSDATRAIDMALSDDTLVDAPLGDATVPGDDVAPWVVDEDTAVAEITVIADEPVAEAIADPLPDTEAVADAAPSDDEPDEVSNVFELRGAASDRSVHDDRDEMSESDRADLSFESGPPSQADRKPAEVVSLFAGEIDGPTTPAEESSPSATVGDLFARLRAARAEVVVSKAVEAAADGGSGPSPGPVDAHVPVDATVMDDDDPVDEAVGESDETVTMDAPVRPTAEEAVVPIILAAARKLKRILADEQNDVLDTLRRKQPVRSLDALLPWEADHSGRYAQAVEDDLVAAGLAGADGGEHGGDPAIVRPALDAVTNEIVAPLRDRLIRCIDKADGDNADLAEQVRTLYREWKTHRIDEHVEDIVRLAYDRGALTLTSR